MIFILRTSIIILLLSMTTTVWSQPITRLVFFNLEHEAGTPEADAFFEKTLVLKEVPSVAGFKILKVEGNMAEYDYVIRLVFKDEEGVEAYVQHPIHNNYLQDVWKDNVTGGKLIDLLEFLPK